MTNFNTGNPIGSTDARDLSDNAQNFDNAVNATGDTWTDRLGVARRTLRSAVGYTGTGTDGAIQSYAAGLVLSGYNVIILYSGEFYRPSASATLPYTTTSTLPDADGNLASIGDANLRQDLANNALGSGAALVSMEGGPSVESAVSTNAADILNRVIRVTSAQEINGFTGSTGVQLSVAGYHQDSIVGGGVFFWANGRHDGGQFIDPDRAFPDFSVPSEVTAWFSDSGANVNGWKRVYTTLDVNMFGAKGNITQDDTKSIQKAIDSNKSLYFPPGNYGVSGVKFNKIGKVYFFEEAALVAKGGASTIVDWQAAFCKIYNMAVVGQFNDTYDSAFHWNSETNELPAKSNYFYNLKFDNVLLAMLFGKLSPASPVNAPQSENFIYGLASRGTERLIYMNQPNGFLKVIGGECSVSKNEWDINNPGVYSYTESAVATVLDGVLGIVEADCLKTETALGDAFIVSGGNLTISGTVEIASRYFRLSGGVTTFKDIAGGFWGNGSDSLMLLDGDSGVVSAKNVTINKSAAASSANTAFIDIGGQTGWTISLSDVRAENQLKAIFGNGTAQDSVWDQGSSNVTINNYTAPSIGGGTTPEYLSIDSDQGNLLDITGTDTIGNDITTWYTRDLSGVGNKSLVTGDAPGGQGYFASIQIEGQVAGAGSSGLYSMDLASLATVKATSIKTKPGDLFQISGWVRTPDLAAGSSDSFELGALFANIAGGAQETPAIATKGNGLITGNWRYVSGFIKTPANSAYIGVGLLVKLGLRVRFAGIKFQKVN